MAAMVLKRLNEIPSQVLLAELRVPEKGSKSKKHTLAKTPLRQARLKPLFSQEENPSEKFHPEKKNHLHTKKTPRLCELFRKICSNAMSFFCFFFDFGWGFWASIFVAKDPWFFLCLKGAYLTESPHKFAYRSRTIGHNSLVIPTSEKCPKKAKKHHLAIFRLIFGVWDYF